MPGPHSFHIRLSAADAAYLRNKGPDSDDPTIRRWARSMSGNTLVLTARDIRLMVGGVIYMEKTDQRPAHD